MLIAILDLFLTVFFLFETFNIACCIFNLQFWDDWRNFWKLFENWHHNKLDKPNLTSCNLSSFSITKEGDIKSFWFFSVSLGKELFEKLISPCFTDIEWSNGSADICSMDQRAWNELLWVFNSQSWWCINEFVNVITILNLIFIKMILKLSSEIVHEGHICI